MLCLCCTKNLVRVKFEANIGQLMTASAPTTMRGAATKCFKICMTATVKKTLPKPNSL